MTTSNKPGTYVDSDQLPLIIVSVVLVALAVVASLVWPGPWGVGWLGGSQ